ncbi:MAG: ribonuclease P protein component 4 [Candidatus Nanoarchaeia archaeon]|jgi:ribonuclease P protein subunit RPR2
MKEYEQIGLERIEILMKMCKTYPKNAKRYTYLAKKISEKIGLPIPKEYKRWICKGCGEYLIPGKNCLVRLKNKTRYITCKECKTIKRFNYAI